MPEGSADEADTSARRRGVDAERRLAILLADIDGISGERVFASLLEASGDTIQLLDAGGRLEFISDAGLKALGLEHDGTIRGTAWPEMWRDDGAARAKTAIAAAKRGAIGRFEAAMLIAGTIRWWDNQVSPIRGNGRRVEKLLCVSRDITGFKQAELRSIQDNLRLRLVMQAAEIGTWDYDLAAERLEVDRRARSILGLAPSGPIAYARSLAALVHPEDKRDFAAAMRIAMDPAGGGDIDLTCRVVDPQTNATRWIELSGSAIVESGRTMRLLGTIHDVTERKKADEHRELLLGEMRHRLKNAFAMVQAIANQTFNDASSVGDASQIFAQRIATLAQASDIFMASEWARAPIDKVVSSALAPYHGGLSQRLRASGPAEMLSAKQALSLSLALHELATNAVKYGALSNETGIVDIIWRTERRPGAPALFVFEWRESGGPAVSAPTRKGFGTKLIERGLAAEFDAEVTLDYLPAGFACTMTGPLAKLRA